MKSLLLVILLFCVNFLYAQNENNVWYFGYGAGLDFNSIGDPIALEDGETSGGEGVASISNSNGELLFYTNGETVWRSDHLVMTNGYNLHGSTNSNQSSIVVPSPANDGIYYLFTLDTDVAFGGYHGLSYSEVDMNQWSGFGAVTENKNINITTDPLFEKLTAVHHANGVDVWVLVQKIENGVYEAYLVTADGINTTPVISDVSAVEALGWIGAMKTSHNGTKVASIYQNKKAEVLDFNSFTGMLSNAESINFYENATDWADSLATWAPYGVEFSPSDQYLYISHLDYGPIGQFDLYADDLSASRIPISPNLGTSNNTGYCSLQLAPNGKIYAASWQEQFVSVINSPDEPAADCNFEDAAISFTSAESSFGLPQFIQSSFAEALFTYNDACRGDTVFFTAVNEYDSLLWDFGDPGSGDNNYSTEGNTFHIYENAGVYTANLELYLSEGVLTSTESVNVPAPLLFLGVGDTVCNGEQTMIDATTPGAISYLWHDDSPNPTKWVSPPGIYWVTVDEGLCVSTDTVEYWAGECAYITYPNIFTPNNDAINDTFLPVQQWFVLKFNMVIYDRWGKEVYRSDDYTEGWDGTNNNGKKVADGTYFYVVEYSGFNNEIRTVNGTVQLARTRSR